jgi:photosystem II stability/assembly factor-like uncharacterized protein
VQATCPIPGTGNVPACASGPFTFGYLGAIDAVSADTVYLVGGRSSLLVSHDSGSTWQTVEPLIGGTDDGTRQVIFFDQSHGIVLGNDGNNDEAATLWDTSDGGTSWSSVVPQTVPS